MGKGRRTEIDFINGHIGNMDAKVDVVTPVSAAVVGIVREIDAKQRRPSPEALELVLRRAGI